MSRNQPAGVWPAPSPIAGEGNTVNRNVLSRLISAVVLALIYRAYIYPGYARGATMGYERFAVYEAARFYRVYSPIDFSAVAYDMFAALGWIACYEGLAFVIRAVLPAAPTGGQVSA
jgi:hypothetical protein